MGMIKIAREHVGDSTQCRKRERRDFTGCLCSLTHSERGSYL
jgi:hypothetical protein